MTNACWARSLGDCSGRISGEHYVSESVFDSDMVKVQGFEWCKHEPKEIPIRTLTANVLCASHNTALSQLDAAAGTAFQQIREATRLYAVRRASRTKSWANTPSFVIDGNRLERWALKTLINFCVRGQNTIGPLGREVGICPPEYVEMAFGRRPFTGRAGLYAGVRAGQLITVPDGTAISIITLVPESSMQVVGALFSLNAFVLGLWLAPDITAFAGLRSRAFGEELRDVEFHRRFSGYDFRIDKRILSHRLKFTWQ